MWRSTYLNHFFFWNWRNVWKMQLVGPRERTFLAIFTARNFAIRFHGCRQSFFWIKKQPPAGHETFFKSCPVRFFFPLFHRHPVPLIFFFKFSPHLLFMTVSPQSTLFAYVLRWFWPGGFPIPQTIDFHLKIPIPFIESKTNGKQDEWGQVSSI